MHGESNECGTGETVKKLESMQMLDFNKAIDQLAISNNMHWYHMK